MSSIIKPNSYTVQPNGSVIVGHGLLKRWKKQLRLTNPGIFKRLVKIKALPRRGKIKGMGKSGNSIYKISGGAVIGGGLFGKIFRAVKHTVRRGVNGLANVSKRVGKAALSEIKKEAKNTFNDIKKIRKPSDVLKLADKLKSKAQRLTSSKYWARRARNVGLDKIGLGKKQRTRGGRRMLGAGPGTALDYVRAPGHLSTAILT